MRNGTVYMKKMAFNDLSPNALVSRINVVRLMGDPTRTTIYKLVKAGKLKLIKLGGRTLVAGDSLRNLLKIDA